MGVVAWTSCLLTLLQALPGYCQVQEAVRIPAASLVIPPGPTAAGLGRYGDVPVNLYTGLPSIAVPLHDASTGTGTPMPIVLNYRASGIRVEEVAGWVGTGWSLECGGVITRTVHGLPDGQGSGYLAKAGQIDQYLNNQLTAAQMYELQKGAADGVFDLQPDVYSYNVAGHTGQFVFDHQGVPLCLDFNKEVITVENGDFKLVTNEGTAYYFQARELSIAAPNGDDNRSQPYVSSWFLTRVEPVIGPPTVLAYSAPQELTYPVNESENHSVCIGTDNSTAGGTILDGRMVINRSRTALTVHAIALKRITTNTQQVDFYTSGRHDLPGGVKLDSLVVQTLAGKLVKRVALTYSAEGNRLFLLAVQEKGRGTAAKPPHLFTYDPTRLPELNAKQQDHWGYYNAAQIVYNDHDRLPTLVPSISFRIGGGSSGVPPTTKYFQGADRTPNPRAMQAGMLTKITYPTGGSSLFEYEPHDYGYLRRTAIPVQWITEDRTLRLRAELSPANNVEVFDSVQIKFTRRQKVRVEGTLTLGTDNTRTGIYADGELGYICRHCPTDPVRYPKRILKAHTGSIDDSVQMYPGLYTFYVLYARLHSGESPGWASLRISKKDSVGTKLNITAGGLRIRRITSQASSASAPLIKEYVYRMGADPERSSGNAVSPLPTYTYIADYFSNGESPYTKTYQILTSYGNGQLGLTQGAPIGYREVTVLEGAEGKGGKTAYKYTSSVEYPDKGDGSAFPFAPNHSFDYRRGKLTQASTYRKTDAGFELIKESTTAYSTGSTRTWQLAQRVTGLKVGYTSKCDCAGLLQIERPDQFATQAYDYTAEWVYPTKLVERVYQPGGTGLYLETKTDYYYASAKHLQVTGQRQVQSDGNRTSTSYRYPSDIVSSSVLPADDASAALLTLVDKRILTPVIEQQTWRQQGLDSVLVGGALTHYTGVLPKKNFQLQVAVPLPRAQFTPSTVQPNGTFQQDSRYVPTLVFDAYDAWGNVQQQHVPNGQAVSYLWGHRGSVPIVMAQNATLAQLRAGLLADGLTVERLEELTTDGGTTSAQFQTLFSRLRQRLPYARLTAYIHEPLVGLTANVDASGRTTYYEYDGLRRLLRTRDDQGRVLSQQQYHYAGH
jgi:YD repeat-containing protein